MDIRTRPRLTYVRTLGRQLEICPNSWTTNVALTGNARASQIQSLFVRNTHVRRENTTRDNAVQSCAERNMYRCETADVTAQLTCTRPAGARPNSDERQQSRRDQTHVYTEKPTKNKWRISSGQGNPAITLPPAILRFIIINAQRMDVIRLMVSNVN